MGWLAYRQALVVLLALGVLGLGSASSLAQPAPPAPTVTTPANGSSVGTTPTYSGTSLAGTTVTVVVDGSSIGSTSADGSGAWSLVQPAPLAQGSHAVNANARIGGSAPSPNSGTNTFTSFPQPTVTGVSPSSGPTAGGTTLAITGSNFTGATAVLFGGTPAAGFIITSNTTLTAVTPVHAAGAVSVAVQTPGGAGTLAGGYTYVSPTITLAPITLPDGTTGTAYSQTITASGGTAPYTYDVTTGVLPAGLTLGNGGTLSGTPTAGGSFTFTITATDAGGFTGSRSHGLTIAPTISVAPTALPNGTAGTAYRQTLTAAGGSAPYSYAIIAGALPAGLTLSAGDTLSGTPTAAGTFNVTITATDAGGFMGSRSYALTIAAPTISVAPTALPNGTAGTAYSQTLTAAGGSAPYSYAIIAGALPPGLTLSAGGALGGTPTASGTFTFTVRATDAGGFMGSRSYSLTLTTAPAPQDPAAATTTGLTTSLNPSVSGQAVTLIATVTSAGGTPTGTLTFTSGSMNLGSATLANGTATLTAAALPVGSNTVTAAYGGATNFAASTGSATQTVTATNTTTALAASPNPSLSGQTVTLTATVTSPNGTPTGTVTFSSGSTSLGSANLTNGTAILATAALPVGSNTLTAAYGGAANFGTSSGSTTQIVTATSTTTALTASPNPSVSGQTVTLTATVASPAGTPTGTVTFTSGSTNLGSATLTNGTAALATAALPVGSNTITAVYGGAGSFGTSTGSTVQTVAAATTTTALIVSPSPSLSGQTVTLTATVTSPGGTPTGTVAFTSGSTSLGSASLANGTATLTTAALPVGSNTVIASYGGAGNFGTSIGSATQTVTASNTVTTLTATPNPSTFGQTIAFTATVTGGLNPTGTVNFLSGGALLGTVAVANGRATFSTVALPAGTNGITAAYSGDANNGASTSSVLNQVVSAAVTTTTLTSSQNPSAVGLAVRFTATISGPGGTPGGTVSFRDGGTILGTAPLAAGSAAFTTSDLAAGPHTITAVYSGDPSYAGSTSAGLIQTVTAAAGGITLTVNTAGRDGSFSFGSTLPGAASFTLSSTGNRITRSFDNVPAGTYAITSLGLPPGFVLQGFSCSNGTGTSNSVTFTVAAGTRVSCSFNAGFDEERVRRTTQAAIRSFLQQRAEAIAQAQPDTRRFHDRFTGAMFSADGAGGLVTSYSGSPVDVTGSTVLGGTNFSASTSLSRLLRPEAKLEFDAWAEVRSGSYRDSIDTNPLTAGVIGPRSRTSGSFTMGFVGLDYRIQPGLLVGVMGQYDQVSQDSAGLGSRASGTGFMIGPYVSMALTPGLFLDARTAYGTSSNLIMPTGLLQRSFSTERQLYRSELSGLYRFGSLALLPSVSALYFSETQHAFTEALGVRIPSQRVGLGQLAVGPEFAYDIPFGRSVLVPRVSVKAIYNFLRDDAASAQLGIIQPTGPLRARVEGGIDLQDYYGFTLGASIAYDGIGDTHYSATSGRLSIRRPF